jgi:hypothetical protein
VSGGAKEWVHWPVARQPYRRRAEHGREAMAARCLDTRGSRQSLTSTHYSVEGTAVLAPRGSGLAALVTGGGGGDRAATVAWRARTRAVGSVVRLRTSCRDGRPVGALW